MRCAFKEFLLTIRLMMQGKWWTSKIRQVCKSWQCTTSPSNSRINWYKQRHYQYSNNKNKSTIDMIQLKWKDFYWFSILPTFMIIINISLLTYFSNLYKLCSWVGNKKNECEIREALEQNNLPYVRMCGPHGCLFTNIGTKIFEKLHYTGKIFCFFIMYW